MYTSYIYKESTVSRVTILHGTTDNTLANITRGPVQLTLLGMARCRLLQILLPAEASCLSSYCAVAAARESCQPNSRARRSHSAVTFLSFEIAPSDFSLASSQVSVAVLHFSASRWYRVACLFASTSVAFM